MTELNGGKQWQIAFWVMATLSTVGLGGIVSATVQNDRLRASEDQRIEQKIENTYDCYHSIDVRLARIEYKLGIEVPDGQAGRVRR